MSLILLLILSSMFECIRTNYITNGGFALPALGAGVLNGRFIDSWTVNWIDLKNESPYMGFGQYVDMQKAVLQNGFIQQAVVLPYNGTYQLNFYQRAKTTNYSLYRVEIYWNGILQATQIPNTTAITYQSLILIGVAGTNVLRFQQTGLDADNHGMHLDEVSLNLVTPWINNSTTSDNTSSLNSSANATNTLNSTNIANSTGSNSTVNATSIINITGLNSTTPINPTNGSNGSNANNGTFTYQILIDPPPTSENSSLLLTPDQLYYLSVIMSLFFNHAVCVRYGFLLLQDLWLYSYDERSYNGVINDVFNTTAFVQELKYKVLEKWLGWMQYLQKIQISDYKSYSKGSVNKSSQILLQVIFPYFVYTFPQTICLCIVLFLGFHILKKTKYGIILRRYSFFWSNLVQSLIQGNIAYFTYIYLGHLSLAFSFTIWDKASLLFSVTFFLFILLFTVLFYFLMGKSLNTSAGYFISCYYRCMPTYTFLISINIMKGILRGTVFYFLSSEYQKQTIFLCLIQVLLLTISVSLQRIYQIFMAKCMFSLYLIYQGTFLILNICLYGDYQTNNQPNSESLNNLFLELEAILIYLLIGLTVCRMVIDFVPLDKFKKKNMKKNEDDKDRQKSDRKRSKKSTSDALLANNTISINIHTELDPNQTSKYEQKVQIKLSSNPNKTRQRDQTNLKININTRNSQVKQSASSRAAKKKALERIPTNINNAKQFFSRLIISHGETH